MEAERASGSTVRRWRLGQGMSMLTAIIVMAVVLVVVGAGSYVGFNAVKPVSQTPPPSCVPSNSPACAAIATTHDLSVLAPFATAQAGSTVPFTAILPSGQTSTKITFDFGDGSAPVTQSSPNAAHSYQYPGLYLISVKAEIKGVVHDSYWHLYSLGIAAAAAASNSADLPGVTGAITGNSSQGSASPTAIIIPSGSVSVRGSYTSSPTNPIFTSQAPTISAPNGVVSNLLTSGASASATVQFTSSGVYQVTFVGTASSPGGTTVVHQDYTWTVFVAPTGVHAGSPGGGTVPSPHKNLLNIYELTPGGARSLDPSIEYDTASGELGLNIYQTLVQYNGSLAGPSPTDFVPQVAVCVPGGVQCGAMFPKSTQGAAAGENLTYPISGGAHAYTFVISSAPQFWDQAHNAHWGIYPTDVMFSIIRTEMFADLPGFSANNGWIIAQSLLDPANNGIHYPLDNTPAGSFARILVNASAYCPADATSNAAYHGCVTFLANAGGINWPFFLELVADWAGAGIEPCGWFSAGAQGASIPGWTDGSAYTSGTGDHPCQLPGGATTTDSSNYKSAVSALTSTVWDNLQQTGSSPPYVGNVQWTAVGSGPYFLAGIQIGASYTLQANPAYARTPSCTYSGCLPAPGQYAAKVQVTWEPTQTEGEQAYQAGISDHSSIPSTDASILLQFVQQGKVQAQAAPTISIYFWSFNMLIPIAAAQKFTTNKITVPADFFSYEAARQFFTHAFPYDTSEQTVNTVHGIVYNFNQGGAIPAFMGNYYPSNISWPSGDPPATPDPTQVGSAAWWWAQGTTSGTPYFDPELAACSTAAPCTVPFLGETGAPAVDQMAALEQSELNTQSGGKLKLITLDVNFATLVNNAFGPPPNPMPFYQLGWAPDYPDPSDYVPILYGNGTGFSWGDQIGPQLTGQAPFDGASYPGGTCPAATDYVGYAHMAATMGGIPTNCQGYAFEALNIAMNLADIYQPNSTRVLLFNYVEQIGNGLALYLHWGQSNAIISAAPWIDPTSINTSIMIGGSSMQPWFTWSGLGVY